MVDPASALLRRSADRLRGTLEVDGNAGGWIAGRGDPAVRVTVHDKRAFGAVLRRGSVGFAESYVAGWWDTEDLTGLVRVLVDNLSGPLRRLDRLGQAAAGPLRVMSRHRAPSQDVDRQNVRAHYDLPPELFTAMLDESMTYSCAVFETPDAPLGDAQLAKLERICTKLALRPDDHVVEIGTGWGSFALHAAAKYGCRVTTTTVSKARRRQRAE